MKTIYAKPVSHASVAPYGSIVNLSEPEGFCLSGELHNFYPDRLFADKAERPLCLSPIEVRKPDRMIITMMEMHNTTAEIILPLNDDTIIHVAPSTPDRPVTDKAEAFIVPKGTAIKINSGIWHLAPLPLHASVLHALIILPQRIYADDCNVLDLNENEYFQIEV